MRRKGAGAMQLMRPAGRRLVIEQADRASMVGQEGLDRGLDHGAGDAGIRRRAARREDAQHRLGHDRIVCAAGGTDSGHDLLRAGVADIMLHGFIRHDARPCPVSLPLGWSAAIFLFNFN